MAIQPAEIRSYTEFWPFYLSQHRRGGTRILHIGGTVFGLFMLIGAVWTLKLFWLIVALPIAYGMAWVGHVFIEHNRPAAFSHPFWSLRGDFHMLGLWMTGRLKAELVRHGISA